MLPSQDRKGLELDLNAHWDKLATFVLEPDLSYEESLARLKLVRLDTLGRNGKKAMTPELGRLLGNDMKVRVKRHFSR